MAWRELHKQSKSRVAAFLFLLWVLFNQGKMTALGIFSGKPGYMFTEAGWSNILAGLIVHGWILVICIGGGILAGPPLASLMGWILRKIKR